MLMIVPKLLQFVVEDHDACRDEGPKFSRVLTRELIGFGGIGVSISLRRGCLLNDVIGIGHTPWLTLEACRASRRARWARRTWRSRWEIREPTRGSWWAWWIVRESPWWTGWSRGSVRRAAWWAIRWATWWTGRSWGEVRGSPAWWEWGPQ